MKDASDVYLDNPALFTTRVDAMVERAEQPGSELGGVLSRVEAILRKYIALPSNHEAVAMTLWAAHTYVFDQFDTSPYLGVTSAEKRCGKTRTLDVLKLLVANPWSAIMPSEAVVYRKIDKERPTLLLDEIDAIFGKGLPKQYEALRALLNAGNRQGTSVDRVCGASMKLQAFSVFSPKVLAGIGDLPETIADRCVPIRLKRKGAGEVVQQFRVRIAAIEAEPIQAALAAEVAAHSFGDGAVVPIELDDRAADGWETLLEIADHAGGSWPKRARAAAVALSGGRDCDSDSLGVRLLTDIAAWFDTRGLGPTPSKDLVAHLRSVEESPWGDYGRDGLNASCLARLLKPYGIRPGNIRLGELVLKGYDSAHFKDAFDRYVQKPATAATTLHEDPGNESAKPECSGVADVAPPGNIGDEATEGYV